MSRGLMAVFAAPDRLQRAADEARARGFRRLDVFTPFETPIAGEEGPETDAIGWWTALGGLIGAGAAYGVEWFSAAFAYPFDSGARPLNSWPVFLFAPFEIGVLVAAVFGLVAFLAATGLPRLHHPAFEIEAMRRASQDRFLLVLARPRSAARRAALEALLGGALEIVEVEL
ncbi:MAG TPA: DUF3341 domain-containing protein [Caulobacteraceae bacterium]|jgi:hypothetical protein|nr:DUF3341 domain-containing protein [Caulobacteraceae bacterium]